MERNVLGETDVITLKNSKGSCRFSLLGATLLSYIPVNDQELLWLGSRNSFTLNKAIRGGIPICWPRFGNEELNKTFPKHGFARNELWTLKSIEETDDRSTATLIMQQSENFKAMQNFEATLHLQIVLSDKLELTLECLNIGDTPITYSEALHTYFAIGAIDQCAIIGLQGANYHDRADEEMATDNEEKLVINRFIDRLYTDTTQNIYLVDGKNKRTILIEKEDSYSTVVWNPYKRTIDDEVLEGDYCNFICIEAANTAHNSKTLAPGTKGRLVLRLSSGPIDN
jgi:D-hexose-6-phosphate mutarotase